MPETLSYQIGLNCPIGADVRQDVAKAEFCEMVGRIRSIISKEIVHLYLSKLEEFRSLGIVADSPSIEENARLKVLDLPSLPNNFSRLLFVNEQLTREWESAKSKLAAARSVADPAQDKRVPTFIVIDEAHNLIPKGDSFGLARAVKEQIKTIAAEGRKYGLFIIAVTQRIDKLDELVTSECKNIAIMKLGDLQTSNRIKEAFGIQDHFQFNEFLGGRFALFGGWADGPGIVGYTAARRTREGGRDIRTEFWATPI